MFSIILNAFWQTFCAAAQIGIIAKIQILKSIKPSGHTGGIAQSLYWQNVKVITMGGTEFQFR